MSSIRIACLLSFIVLLVPLRGEECVDFDLNCRDWVNTNERLCNSVEYITARCRKSCHLCGGPLLSKFDVRRLDPILQPLAFLVGIWRSEHGGKAIFPTIPKFTYGEQLEFSIPDTSMRALSALNYTAFAWGVNEKHELHSEYGYLAMKPGTNIAALTTVMDNGFVTIEEGPVVGTSIIFKLHDIGRISFSRDLPVHQMIREWRLLNPNLLEAKLAMETLTHGMQEHTFIRYDKIYP